MDRSVKCVVATMQLLTHSMPIPSVMLPSGEQLNGGDESSGRGWISWMEDLVAVNGPSSDLGSLAARERRSKFYPRLPVEETA